MSQYVVPGEPEPPKPTEARTGEARLALLIQVLAIRVPADPLKNNRARTPREAFAGRACPAGLDTVGYVAADAGQG